MPGSPENPCPCVVKLQGTYLFIMLDSGSREEKEQPANLARALTDNRSTNRGTHPTGNHTNNTKHPRGEARAPEPNRTPQGTNKRKGARHTMPESLNKFIGHRFSL